MIKRLVIIFIIFSFAYTALIMWAVQTRPSDAYAVTCHKTGERISGTKKVSYYNCLGNTEEVTVSSVEWVPLPVENESLPH